MGLSLRLARPAAAVAFALLISGCSGSQDRSSAGALAVRLAAERAAGPSDDPTSRLLSANINISGIEARKGDGTWVPLTRGVPATVDFLALASVGDTVTLPAERVPEGHYTALQVRVTRLELTLQGGTRLNLDPRAASWVVLIPVDFSMVPDHGTQVGLNLRLDQSLKLAHGAFEFDPVFEVDGVERID